MIRNSRTTYANLFLFASCSKEQSAYMVLETRVERFARML